MRILLFLVALGMFMPALAANRLATADSPYLRTHAENPVDWYPWSDEAFEKAKREGKPVFLSIGYSSCYWCRVAEETLYRDPKIAAQMNAGFINVKVDREQRPDLDRLYSIANQELGGSGGWPNNLFLTPERKPFYAGSYFPPEDDDLGRTGFPKILARIDTAWKSRRHEVEALAERVATAMRQRTLPAVSVEPAIWRRQAAATLMAREDRAHGGLGNDSTAKFPQVPELTLLAAHAEGRFVVRRAMEAMARSALYDHLDGGFHRYTIDEPWNQPHFEKMLYDNAQLLRLYAVEGRGPLQRAAALATAEFMLTRMQAPEGGFYASFDAVSDGREGAHYLWGEEEIRTVLGPAAEGFLAAYRIVPMPDHPGEAFENIGREHGTLRMSDVARQKNFTNERKRLLQHRDRRPAPARDDKIILGWNGLAIEALAVAGEKLSAPRLTQAARKAADRLWRDAWEPAHGRLRQANFEGRAQGEGFLEDYALFGLGLLAVGQRERAIRLADVMLARFARTDGGLVETVHAAELFVPVPESGDGPYPSGASAAYRLLSRLAKDDPRFIAPADKLLAALAPLIARAPDRWPSLLSVLPDQTGMAKRDSGVDPAAGSAGVVSAAARWQGHRLVVVLRMAPGWHVNANPASFDYLIPTQLGFTGAQPSSVRYPGAERFRATFTKSDITVYSGAVTIEAEFTAKRPTAARLTVQACSAEVCLPPADLVLSPR